MEALFSFDFSTLFTLENMFAIIFGTLFGLLVGALPGLGATIGIALLLPVTYTMDPLPSVILLISVYMASEYGGSISAIVLGVPGTAAAVATVLDGSPMAKQGFPGKALAYSLTASTIGGFAGGIVLMTLTVPLSKLTIRFSDPEFVLLGILGLVCVASLSSKDIPKSILSVLFGLLFSLIGQDSLVGFPRFTFGSLTLLSGISYVPLIVGMFAFSEVYLMLGGDLNKRYVTDKKNLKTKITWKEFKNVWKNILRGSIIGSLTGILPGLGGGPASWFAYTEARRTAKNPENFGKGEPNGIAAAESANNATVGGAMIPLLTLGIPGSPSTAVILGALMIQGIQPGPMVFLRSPDLINGIFWGFILSVFAMYFIGKYTTSLWARMLTIPNYALIPIVLIAAYIGAYSKDLNIVDVWIAIIAGVVAYLMRKLNYSLPAFILAFILGPLIETGMRRSLMLSSGSLSIFIERGYSLTILIIIILMLGSQIYTKGIKNIIDKPQNINKGV